MAWALPIFQHSGTGYIEIRPSRHRSTVDSCHFSQKFSERALLYLKNQSRFQSRNWSSDRRSGTGYVEIAGLFHADFNDNLNHEFNHDFTHSKTPL